MCQALWDTAMHKADSLSVGGGIQTTNSKHTANACQAADNRINPAEAGHLINFGEERGREDKVLKGTGQWISPRSVISQDSTKGV